MGYLQLIQECYSTSPVCNTLLLFAMCQHYNANDLSDEPDFNIVYYHCELKHFCQKFERECFIIPQVFHFHRRYEFVVSILHLLSVLTFNGLHSIQ